MSESTPEVKLNFEADSAQAAREIMQLTDMFREVGEIVRRTSVDLQNMRADALNVAGVAQTLQSNAAASGNAKAAMAAEKSFSFGTGEVAGYANEITELENRHLDLGRAMASVLAACKEGKMGFAEAEAALAQLKQAAVQADQDVRSLAAGVRRSMSELGEAAELNAVLEAWRAYTEQIAAAAARIDSTQDVSQELSVSLRGMNAALDANSASYEQQFAAVSRARRENLEMSRACESLRMKIMQLGTQGSEAMGKLVAGGDYSGAKEALGELSAEVERYVSQVEAYADEMSESGFRVAEELAEVQKAAAESAEESAARLSEAAENVADAAGEMAEAQEEVAEAFDKTSYAMQLAAMNKVQLAEETKRLIAAQKAAAAAGDTKAYAKLTQQLSLCRTAMRQLNQAAQMNKITLMQQAQTAAMIGSQLSSLGSQVANLGTSVREGTVDITGMTSSVMSLSMAFKAGLGPLGAFLLLVQGLQMAWNAFAKSKVEKEKALAEALERQAEEDRKLYEKARSIIKKSNADYQKNSIEEMGGKVEGIIEFAREMQQGRAELRRVERAEQDEDIRHQETMIRAQMQNADEATQKRLENELANLERLKEGYKAARAQEDAEEADSYVDSLESGLEELNDGKYKDVLQFQLPDLDELQQIKGDLARLQFESNAKVKDAKYADLEKRGNDIQKQMSALLHTLKKADPAWHGTYEEAVKFAEELQKRRNKLKEELDTAKEKANTEHRNAELAKKEEENRQKEIDEQQKAKEARRAKEQAVQREREQLDKILRDTKTAGHYNEKDARAQADIFAADRELLDARMQQLQDLRARTSDKKLQERLDAAIADTAKQYRALSQSLNDAARKHTKAMLNAAPEGDKARSKGRQASLDRATESYVAHLRRAGELIVAANNEQDAEKRARMLDSADREFARAKSAAERAERLSAEPQKIRAQLDEAQQAIELAHEQENARKAQQASTAAINEGTAIQKSQNAQARQRLQQQQQQPGQGGELQAAQAATRQADQAAQELRAQAEALAASHGRLAEAVSHLANSLAGIPSAIDQTVSTLQARLRSIEDQLTRIWSRL